MENLDSITQHLDLTIKDTLDKLTLHSIASIVRKLRKYGVNDQIEFQLETKNFKVETFNPLKEYETFFDEKVKAFIYDKKEDVIIHIKKEIKDLFMFSFRFDHCAFSISINLQMDYNEKQLIEELTWKLYQNQYQGASYDLDRKVKEVFKEIENLDIMDEKKQLEKLVDNSQSSSKLKI